MSEAPETFHLPRFRERLDQMSAREAGLPPDTHQRYKKGKLPKVLIGLLLRRPELARALYDDLRKDTQAA